MIPPKITEAAVLFETKKDLRITPLQVPELKPGQVLVQIAYSGICHTQLLEVQGAKGKDPYLPHTLGHEGSGSVICVSETVTKVKPGDHVVLSWIKGSGAEVPSTRYASNQGHIHSGAISTFMQYAVISENRVTSIPYAIPLREAALLGCAIPTGVGMVFNTSGLRPGGSLAVFGVGGIGMSAIHAAEILNASIIIAVDIHEHKLEWAKHFGATHVIHAGKEDAPQRILNITNQKGVDCAIESAGMAHVMEAAFKATRKNGGICILAGNLPHGEAISINPFDLIQGKKIIGTWGGETRIDQDIPFYVNLYLAGRLHLNDFITHEYTLGQINHALQDLQGGKVGRALIKM
ncbi:MAG: zinc-binding dehydrogenase [Deltaproteobacteria bacterium]|nr:zinc-binding dehydrogenase [Deltaproteobacteria bacterium]